MKRFTFNIFLFLLPILIIGVALEFFLREIPNQYTLKANYIITNSSKIETLVLGSSHTYYGVNPVYFTKPCFNIANISQSLNFDYELLKKHEHELNNLNTVIIPISYFSLFEKLDEGEESWRIKNYTIYYDLDVSDKLAKNSEVLSISLDDNISRISSYYLINNFTLNCSELGWGNSYRLEESLDLDKTGISSAKRHTIDHLKLLEENLTTLKSIINLCNKHNVNVLLFTPPAYESYYKNLNKMQLDITINNAQKLSGSHGNCTYINLLKDSSFTKNDFYDADHLNNKGAKKLSELLNDLISN